MNLHLGLPTRLPGPGSPETYVLRTISGIRMGTVTVAATGQEFRLEATVKLNDGQTHTLGGFDKRQAALAAGHSWAQNATNQGGRP